MVRDSLLLQCVNTSSRYSFGALHHLAITSTDEFTGRHWFQRSFVARAHCGSVEMLPHLRVREAVLNLTGKSLVQTRLDFRQGIQTTLLASALSPNMFQLLTRPRDFHLILPSETGE